MGANVNRPNLTQLQKKKLEEGKPILFPGGIKITKNIFTGLLQGVPAEWANNYSFPYNIDYKKLQCTKSFPRNIQASEDLPQSILQLINSIPPDISLPINLEHNHHVEVQYGHLKNLPAQWVGKVRTTLFEANVEYMQEVKGDLQLHESQVEYDLLSTSQFESMIKSVHFIEKQPYKQFIFKKELGHGAMCKVYFVYDKQEADRKYYACRIIKLKDERMLDKIRKEIAVMNLCNSNNLTEHFFTYYYKETLFMFVQFMDGGAMVDLIYHYLKKIPQPIIAYILRQILKGLESLHSRRQLHRDLKSDNILLSLNGDVKIADFGYAIQLTKEILNRKSLVGTPAWMAPQLICRQPYDEKVDIWSLGIVAIQLAQGQPPFLRMNHRIAMQKIVNTPPPRLNRGSKQLADFVDCCLRKLSQERKSSKELLHHPFITKIGQGEQERKKLVAMLRDIKKSSLSSIIRELERDEFEQ